MSERLARARRIVVKIGSALLVDTSTGRLKQAWLETLADDLAALHRQGADILVVSSGSIALGARLLKLPPRARQKRLEESQAAAAVGQIVLARAWAEALGRHDIVAGQILLTLMDTEERRRYLNARATLNTLLKHRAVPVINENDTVATDEIRYGDNDRLAARVASMMHADCLVLLSDVDGLYSAPPGTEGARHIPEVSRITPRIMAMAGDAETEVGSGGMRTKLEAARIATQAGVNMVIASGREMHPIRRILDGARCTWFTSSANPVAARKRWIAGSLVPAGDIVVDAGAAAALKRNKSLLPVGVIAARGRFSRGDAVRILDEAGNELGRGLVNYDHAEVDRIRGLKSDEIAAALGYAGRDVLIHKDDLVLTGAQEA
ncbi:glutamate 5-kinase [Thermopetrobacter sp. TC1]|uniref:glutamate 5-kinase n=1 Tax=Thermopetrobacter sp. TC1 TaxID=1495045 RepID=UPI00056FDE10|nr:glutamate 5-kinase [Thermopetrobacter sp. TC1]